MNDLTNWKIIELHRRGADKQTWYFGVTKPDGKRLYANTPSGHERVIYSAKAPSPVKFSTAEGGYNGSKILKIHGLSEAGVVRKIMLNVDALAAVCNTRLSSEEAGMK